MRSAPAAHETLGPIRLGAGITRRHALTYFYAAFFTIGLVSVVSFMQPYLLSNNPDWTAGMGFGYTNVSGLLVPGSTNIRTVLPPLEYMVTLRVSY